MQTGFDVVLEPKDAPALKTRRHPQGRRAGSVLGRPGPSRRNGRVPVQPGALVTINRRGPLISLIRDDGPVVPVSYAGPFRVNLIGLSRHRDLTPARSRWNPKISEAFFALLEVFAEPGLILSGNGPLVLEDA